MSSGACEMQGHREGETRGFGGLADLDSGLDVPAEPEVTEIAVASASDGEESQEDSTGQELVLPETEMKHPLENRLYNHIQVASHLMSGCDYSLFKDGIEPMWEDEQNKRGGRWLVTLSKGQRHSDLDRFWLETLLCLIGEAFDDHSDNICGAVVNIRGKGDKVAVWTRDCENREGIMTIGKVYKERLGLSGKMHLGYESHSDTATKSGSTTKSMFTV
uniref:Eukaryotic translation initiation factor 4E-like isoform X4 n=1 Tax=Petromyzon marinus TaxID=7757 RepID=A0AAJ7SUW9_PETMA|nr:eukaryotic translation initiation factor 4E-like isoform X4 [Petromyzon marinus]